MKIESLRRLRGPNVYLSRPAIVAALRLEELTGRETSDVTGFAERLLRALPGLTEHHCAAGAPGGFVSRLRGGTYFGHVTEHVCLELSQIIGRDVSFGRFFSVTDTFFRFRELTIFLLRRAAPLLRLANGTRSKCGMGC